MIMISFFGSLERVDRLPIKLNKRNKRRRNCIIKKKKKIMGHWVLDERVKEIFDFFIYPQAMALNFL